MRLDEVLQALYASELNCQISTFWDGGYAVKLGDAVNGFVDESDGERTPQEVARTLDRMAREHYPDSDYAKTEAQS
jgi:hypothetical protein